MKSWYQRFPMVVATLPLATLSAAVLAATEPETGAEPYQLEEIVVTATKTGEVSAQALPQSISVFSASDINEAGIHTVEDVVRLTPGLNLTRNGPWTRLYMRGIGTNLDFIGSDPSVTVHVDGVYQARTSMVLDELLDVERIEVLRGPQGTLYGRNSTGGTINIITRLPDAAPRSTVSAELGSYSLSRVMASASGGLGSDAVIGSVAVVHTEHDPYVDNVNPNGADGMLDENLTKANSSLQFELGDIGKLILRGDYSTNNKSSGAYQTTGLNTVGAPVPFAPLLSIPADPFELNQNLADPHINQEAWGTSAELQIDLSDAWMLTSLTAYRTLDNDAKEDTDGSNLPVLVTTIKEQQDQTSEELRLNYSGEALQVVTGVFLLSESHEQQSALNATLFDVENDVAAYALFTEMVWSVTQRLNLTGGLRYSVEKKEFSRLLPTAYEDSETWDDVSPKVALDYSLTDDAMVYVSASKGFKSGGYNFTSIDADSARYDPEEVWAYETGIKMNWADGRARSNVALFWYDYTDLQVSDFTQVGSLTITNAASATIQGVELENEFQLGESFTLIFNMAVLDATYDEYQAAVASNVYVDVSDNQLNAAPTNKYTLGALYWLTNSWGDWVLRTDYAWQDKQYFTAFNEDVSSQGAYGLLSASATLTTLDDHLELQIYGNNLTNEDYATSSREFLAAATGVTRDINPPRTLGTRLTYHF